MYATAVKLAGQPVEQAVPTMIVINRNSEPSLVEFIVSDESSAGGTRFDTVKNPVDIEITTPDESQQAVTLKLEKWYITAVEPHSPGLWSVVVQDVRWTAQAKRLTKDYNVYETGAGVDPIARKSSLNNGAPWTCYDAAIDALKEFGFEIDSDGISNALKKVELPRNLGNSPLSGGFVGAPLGYVMPLLLEPIHCDFVIRPNGKIRIINRNFDRTHNLEEFVGVSGVVGKRDIHWQKPKRVSVLFETRVARYFSYTESETIADGLDLAVQNVCPMLASSDYVFGTDSDGGYGDLLSNVRAEVGLSLSQIRERWLKPLMVQIFPSDTNAQKDHKAYWDSIIRQHFRRTFRIRDLDGSKSLVDVRIGHIGPNGNTVTERCVYMPFTYIARYTDVSRDGSPEDIIKTKISRGYDIDLTADGFRPAPFQPILFMDRRNGSVLLHLEQMQSNLYIQLHPGRFVREVSFGDAANLVSDNVDLPTVYTTPLASNFYMRVYYHGLLVADRPDLGLTRLTKVTRDLFGEGPVEEVQYYVRDLTANYGYETKTDLANNSLILLNASDVSNRADFIAEQVKKNFNDGRSGVFSCGGIAAAAKGGFWVDGTINNMHIVIGGRSPWSIETRYVVMPEVNPVVTHDMKKALDGAPVYLIGGQ